ncbi:MAG TPA: hypothetical protein PK367_00525 [Candidatus Paceibacterota bacterium]|nr:hypothetical protein [Candidatus Paceibacterota bacterium]
MKKLVEKRESAIKLRESGYSLTEIVNKLKVSKSSASSWVSDIKLSQKAKNRLLTKIKLGQFISAERKKNKTKSIIDNYFLTATKEQQNYKLSHLDKKIMCSIMYWCEGAKSLMSGVQFINSDPSIVKAFVNLLADSFGADRKRFKVCVHIHSYHNSEEIINFWSNEINLPKEQFLKPYRKNNSGQNIHKDYKGCVSVRYNDVSISRQLLTTARAFLLKY